MVNTSKVNKRIAIVIDSSCGLDCKKYPDVYLIPLNISTELNKEVNSYKDIIDIGHDDICKLQLQGGNIKTGASSPGDILKLFVEISPKYDEIYCFPICPSLSSSINSWKTALEMSELKNIEIFSQLYVGAAFEWTIREFIDMRSKGTLNKKAVLDFLATQGQRYLTDALLPNLTYVMRGGRISKVKGSIINLLHWSVVIQLNAKGLEKFGVAKTYKQGIKMVCHDNFKKMLAGRNIKRVGIFLSTCHADTFDSNKYVKDIEDEFRGFEIERFRLPSVIVAHTGPNYIGLCIEAE